MVVFVINLVADTLWPSSVLQGQMMQAHLFISCNQLLFLVVRVDCGDYSHVEELFAIVNALASVLCT